MAELDEQGREIPDRTPIEVPLRFKKNISEAQRTKELIRTVLSDYAASQGQETFEESCDFDVPDDPGDLDFGVSPSEMRTMADEQLIEDLRDARDPAKIQEDLNRSAKRGKRQSGNRSERVGESGSRQGSGSSSRSLQDDGESDGESDGEAGLHEGD